MLEEFYTILNLNLIMIYTYLSQGMKHPRLEKDKKQKAT